MQLLPSSTSIRSFLLVIAMLFAQLATAFPANASEKASIDLLILYTEGTATRYGGDPSTRFHHLVNVANQTYIDSGVDLELEIVHTQQVDYSDDINTDTALREMTRGDGVFANVEALRMQYGADMVVLFRPYNRNQGGCGLAWVGGAGSEGDMSRESDKRYAYSQVAVSTCPDYTLVHELGHNMGLRHSRESDSEGGTFSYALGHGEDGSFSTVMAYQSSFNADYWSGKIYKFSNPNKLCKGSPCGVDRSLPNGADAAYTLNITGAQIASFYHSAQTETETETDTESRQRLENTEHELNGAKRALVIQSARYKKLQQDNTAAYTTLSNTIKFGKQVFIQYLQNVNQQRTFERGKQLLAKKFRAAFTAYKNASAEDKLELRERIVAIRDQYERATNEIRESVKKSDKWRDAAKRLAGFIKNANNSYDQTRLELEQVKEQLSQLENAVVEAEHDYQLARNT